MPAISLSPVLRNEYENLFNACVIRRINDAEAVVGRLQRNQPRYEDFGTALGIPWFFIAVVHCMEGDCDFKTHLHNGDPLTARTVQEPKARPVNGNPPFTWEESATDALTMKHLGAQTDWSLAGTLFQLEKYNGWGYRTHHPHVLSPYLWSFSNHYTSGKYVKDGVWSDTAASRQCGAAVMLRRMAEKDLIEFADQPTPTDAPAIVSYSMRKSPDPAVVARVEELQRWLSTHPGVFVRADGIPGRMTSEAYRRVTGSFLPGDPRA